MVIVASDGSLYCGLVGNSDVFGSYQLIIRPTKRALDLPSATVNGEPSQTVSILNGVDLSGTASR